MNTTILIVDDNEQYRTSLIRNFERTGRTCVGASCAQEALDCYRRGGIALCLLDVMLNPDNGLELMPKLLEIRPEVPIIFITGFATIELAVEAIRKGALDYIQKPVKFEALSRKVDNALRMARLSHENTALRARLDDLSPQIIASSAKMADALDQARRLAATNIPILLVGENGTGKEVFADLIHRTSSKALGKLVKLNCSAFPESLLDNELFGHEKGAYTDAGGAHAGMFETAQGGTLFLDEIGDMSMSLQPKLLRALQNREIRRLGSSVTLTIDVRFLAATNRDLEKLIQEGKFREDLYYRINAAIITIPPLRQRQEDILPLAEHFLREFSHTGEGGAVALAPDAVSRLQDYSWPGNVRELRNAVLYASALCSGDCIGVHDLPPSIGRPQLDSSGTTSTEALGEAERLLIIKTLQKHKNNKKRSAESLSISRGTLYGKMKKHGLLG